MASAAISAQGSKMYIGSGTTGAKTITAITQAYRAQVTSSAHALEVGDRVTFAAVVGMTEINTLVGTVIAKDTNTFVVNIDSRAFTAYASDGTATPVEWTQIKQVQTFSWEDGEGPDIDITDLDSTSKEYLVGLQDPGNFSVGLTVNSDDPGQVACVAAKTSGDIKDFKIELPNSKLRNFSGIVKSMPETGGVDSAFTGSMSIRISGEVTRA